MRSNGITSSALSLLDNIDHDRFDVSVCYWHSTRVDPLRNEAGHQPQRAAVSPGGRHERQQAAEARAGTPC
jgi:hypothetical protein